ncbi:MAG: response regulator [Bacteroidetes bacterium]|nr:MAG: response regulator [Bacteroidota bacterium]
MTCIVVDDDEFSREVIKQYVERSENLDLLAECQDAIEAYALLKRLEVDIIFLDVEMPQMTGIELIKSLDKLPQIVLITSRSHYAVEAFENSVTDYLVKPVKYARFLQAVEKIEKNFKPRFDTNLGDSAETFFIKVDGKIVKVRLEDVAFVEALADYVVFNTPQKKYIVHSTMKNVSEKLGENFVRVHRSFIINTDHIDSIEDTKVMIANKAIPIGASYKNEFIDKLNFLL